MEFQRILADGLIVRQRILLPIASHKSRILARELLQFLKRVALDQGLGALALYTAANLALKPSAPAEAEPASGFLSNESLFNLSGIALWIFKFNA